MDPGAYHGGQYVIPTGQEGLVRRMVAPPLPAGWTFVSAAIRGPLIRARYARSGPPRVAAEFVLEHPEASADGSLTGRFRARLRVSSVVPSLAELRAALLSSVCALEVDFVWAQTAPSEVEETAPTFPAADFDLKAFTAIDPEPDDGDLEPHEPTANAETAAETAPETAVAAEPIPAAPSPSEPIPAALTSTPPQAPSRIPDVFRRALSAFERGGFDDALADLAAFAETSDAPREAVRALAMRFEMMCRLGRYHEALVDLDAALTRFPASVALHAAAATLRAELYDDRAAEHARVMSAHAGASSDLGLRAATVLLALGHEDEARRAAERVIEASAKTPRELLLDVANLYRDAGDFDAAEALYERVLAVDSANVNAHIGAGTLRAWRGDADGARAHAEAALASAPRSAAAVGLRGAARVLAGDPDGAIEDLHHAARLDAGDPVNALWRAEALLRLGKPAEALEEAKRGGELSDDTTNHVAAQVLISLAQIRVGAFPGLPDYVLQPALATLRAEATAADGRAPPPEEAPLEEALQDGLARLRGNRSSAPTYVRRDGALVRLAVPPSPRVAAKRSLWRLVATGDGAETLRALDRIHEESPRAAEPYNYRGELFLYLGDAAAARREFERAIALYRRSRWAYIGLAGAAILAGDLKGAIAALDEGVAQAGTPGPTFYVYRGEALRLMGRTVEARAHLQYAVQRHPSRVGAWVNLALLDTGAGNLDQADAVLTRLRRHAPGFVADAFAGLGLDPAADPDLGGLDRLMTEMLAMLRGNRGSSCVTYFTRDGRLRTVPPVALAQSHRALLQRALTEPP